MNREGKVTSNYIKELNAAFIVALAIRQTESNLLCFITKQYELKTKSNLFTRPSSARYKAVLFLTQSSFILRAGVIES